MCGRCTCFIVVWVTEVLDSAWVWQNSFIEIEREQAKKGCTENSLLQFYICTIYTGVAIFIGNFSLWFFSLFTHTTWAVCSTRGFPSYYYYIDGSCANVWLKTLWASRIYNEISTATLCERRRASMCLKL